jgi:polyisoprenoid-binding protein YceI
MAAFGPERAECLVFTYKDGMLSAVAHDLKLRVGRFTVEVADDASAVDARFDARSLEVVGAMRHGAGAAGGPSARDRHTIESNLKKDVLAADRYPEIRFVSSSVARDGDRAIVQGTLTLHGRARPLTVEARRSDGRWRARVTLRQPDFGIKPYSAMLGTLRIKPEVIVEISLPEH